MTEMTVSDSHNLWDRNLTAAESYTVGYRVPRFAAKQAECQHFSGSRTKKRKEAVLWLCRKAKETAFLSPRRFPESRGGGI